MTLYIRILNAVAQLSIIKKFSQKMEIGVWELR